MKLDSIRLANAFALAMGVLWIICSVFVYVFPGFSYQILVAWMHGMTFSPMGAWDLTINNFIFGGVTAVTSAWISGLVFGWSMKKVQ